MEKSRLLAKEMAIGKTEYIAKELFFKFNLFLFYSAT